MDDLHRDVFARDLRMGEAIKELCVTVYLNAQRKMTRNPTREQGLGQRQMAACYLHP